MTSKSIRFANLVKGADSWNDIFDRLSPYNDPGEKRAGTLFEDFCVAYFKAVPAVSREFVNVWHHPDIPQGIRKKLTINQRDHGVDALVQHHDGRYFAVQCKFKTDQSAFFRGQRIGFRRG